MQISRLFSPTEISSISGNLTAATAKVRNAAAVTAGDTVTISNKAMEMLLGSKSDTASSVSDIIASWYNQYMTVDGKVAPAPDYASWVPGNKEYLKAIWDEQTKIIEASPDPQTRSRETNELLAANLRKIAVIEALGDSLAVTGQIMQEGLDAYDNAESAFLRMQVDANQAAADRMARMLENSDELEKQLQEWQQRQFGQNGSAEADSTAQQNNAGETVRKDASLISQVDDGYTVSRIAESMIHPGRPGTEWEIEEWLNRQRARLENRLG